jgi:hypothetical protein
MQWSFTLPVALLSAKSIYTNMFFSKRSIIHQGLFGSCCDDLKKCMAQPNALIRISEENTLFLTIGYMETDKGVGWFDHAIIYCPFCGKQLQDCEELRKKVSQAK